MSQDTIVVFLNGRAVQASPGSTLGDLIARELPELARHPAPGTLAVTDGRGVPVTGAEVLTSGSIFTVKRSARSADSGGTESGDA
jgi:hypothetical protein